MEAQPDLTQLSDAELKDMIRRLTDEEREVSRRRRVLHGRIDMLKTELVSRLKGRDEGELSVVDVATLATCIWVPRRAQSPSVQSTISLPTAAARLPTFTESTTLSFTPQNGQTRW